MFLNRVKFTTATTGTGSVTVGTAPAGFFTPVQAGAYDDERTYYVIEDGTAFEIGETIASSSATVWSRELEQSSTGALLNLSGSATMYFTPTAAQMDRRDKRGKATVIALGGFLN